MWGLVADGEASKQVLCFLVFPSYSAFRQQSMITNHRLMMHVITLSRKHVITFTVFSRGLHLFLGMGLAIEQGI
jgi:hypothetical protein